MNELLLAGSIFGLLIRNKMNRNKNPILNNNSGANNKFSVDQKWVNTITH